MKANVILHRVLRDGNVVVKLIATVEADTREEALEKGLADIKEVLPHDGLFANRTWYWDDEDEAEVEWMDSEADASVKGVSSVDGR